MIERQTIVTWEDPKKKKPEPCVFVVVTVSAKLDGITYGHALAIADYWDDDEENGWSYMDPMLERHADQVTMHAWADLEPYAGGRRSK